MKISTLKKVSPGSPSLPRVRWWGWLDGVKITAELFGFLLSCLLDGLLNL